jgi:hypothetical protein
MHQRVGLRGAHIRKVPFVTVTALNLKTMFFDTAHNEAIQRDSRLACRTNKRHNPFALRDDRHAVASV